jgi:hypothetical protein
MSPAEQGEIAFFVPAISPARNDVIHFKLESALALCSCFLILMLIALKLKPDHSASLGCDTFIYALQYRSGNCGFWGYPHFWVFTHCAVFSETRFFNSAHLV